MALIVNTAFLPLIQNDSLEYATVGRLLFESATCFRILPSTLKQAGPDFYGPWTHPPLYAALIYLSYVFQGNAESPGLMHADHCPLVCYGCDRPGFYLGKPSNRLTGILSALVFSLRATILSWAPVRTD